MRLLSTTLYLYKACVNYTQSYLHYLIGKEEVACHLISIHNLRFLIKLMLNLRESIIKNNLEEFMNEFLLNWFSVEKEIPNWVKNALEHARI